MSNLALIVPLFRAPPDPLGLVTDLVYAMDAGVRVIMVLSKSAGATTRKTCLKAEAAGCAVVRIGTALDHRPGIMTNVGLRHARAMRAMVLDPADRPTASLVAALLTHSRTALTDLCGLRALAPAAPSLPETLGDFPAEAWALQTAERAGLQSERVKLWGHDKPLPVPLSGDAGLGAVADLIAAFPNRRKEVITAIRQRLRHCQADAWSLVTPLGTAAAALGLDTPGHDPISALMHELAKQPDAWRAALAIDGTMRALRLELPHPPGPAAAAYWHQDRRPS